MDCMEIQTGPFKNMDQPIWKGLCLWICEVKLETEAEFWNKTEQAGPV